MATDADFSEAELLLDSAPGRLALPEWSPDGAWLAFPYETFGEATRGIYRMRPNGDDLHPLALFEVATTESPVYWSPDGERIAFVGIYPSDFDVHTVEVASGRVTRYALPGTVDLAVWWSPDGAWLHYLGVPVGGQAAYSYYRVPLGVPDAPPQDILRAPGGPDAGPWQYFSGEFLGGTFRNGLYRMHYNGTARDLLLPVDGPLYNVSQSPPVDFAWSPWGLWLLGAVLIGLARV